MGIPAVCVGCVRGGGAHTREEYVEIDSLAPGLGVAFEMILSHFEQ
jgi:acetylornithine deacetylase/succinyl-diaminopimelate desuccinylase-like protein